MKKTFITVLFAALALTGFGGTTPAASDRVTVIYNQPDNFTDFKSDRMGSEDDQKYLMDIFTAHLTQHAGKLLDSGQKLEVKFIDIDLAGAFEPWRGPQMDNVRIMKEIYPPRMKFDFKLLGVDGKVISEGKRELVDLSYQSNLVMANSDPFRYDKNLLTDWMRREFGKK